MTTTTPTRLDVRHLTNHARCAIADRLRYDAPEALRSVERDGDAVIIRVNSGGNALAVQHWLNARGYRAEYAGFNPDGYGCAVRVTLRAIRSSVAALEAVKEATEIMATSDEPAKDANQ